MADYAIPKNGVAFILYTGLIDQSNTKLLKASPTLASGDFKISIDGGAFANLATLPTVTPAAGTAVKISLSAAEMSGDNIVVTCIDAAGAEWCDQLIDIQTSARGVADLAYPATSGRSMVVDASGLVDANAVKLGPTGAGTAQTARDLGLALPAAAPQAAGGLITSTAGSLDLDEMNVDIEAIQVSTAGLTYTVANQLDVNVLDWKSATAPAMTGDAFARLGAPAGASVSADIAAAKVDTAAIKVQTDKLAFTVANQVDANVLDWKSATAPAMTGDAFARLGAPAGASVSADIAAVKSDTGTILTDVNSGAGAIYTRIGAPAGASIAADIAAVKAVDDAVKAKTDNLPASPAAVGSAMTLANGAITDATITFPAEASGRPTTFLAAMRRVWEWMVNKRTRDTSTGTVLLRNSADSATLETQTQSTSGTTDTQTKGA